MKHESSSWSSSWNKKEKSKKSNRMDIFNQPSLSRWTFSCRSFEHRNSWREWRRWLNLSAAASTWMMGKRIRRTALECCEWCKERIVPERRKIKWNINHCRQDCRDILKACCGNVVRRINSDVWKRINIHTFQTRKPRVAFMRSRFPISYIFINKQIKAVSRVT